VDSFKKPLLIVTSTRNQAFNIALHPPLVYRRRRVPLDEKKLGQGDKKEDEKQGLWSSHQLE
jgi:hypothetical protein